MAKRAPRNSSKDPSFQFYWKDWLSDTRLMGLPKKAKGVWIDLMCISMDMPVRGVFHDGKRALFRREINGKLTGNRREINEATLILVEKDILKTMPDGPLAGSLYVKRIYRDMQIREIRREAGRKGGNPALLNYQVKQNAKQKPESSSSSSTSYPISLSKCRRCGGVPIVKTATDDTGVIYGLCTNCARPNPESTSAPDGSSDGREH